MAAASPAPKPRTRKASTTPRKPRAKKAAPEEDPAPEAAAAAPPPPPAAAPAPAAAPQALSSSDEEDLEALHRELLQQIEERKKAQAALGGRPAAKAGGAPPTELSFPAPAPAPPPPPPVAEPAPPAPAAAAPPAPAPPARHPDALNIVMVGAECAPWSKTGGLGDVMGALPKALAARGHRVMAFAPRYACYEDAWETGVRIRVRVFGQDHEVGFFHCFVDGVDHVFLDHPAFLSIGAGGDLYGGSRQDVQFRCALLSKAALEAPWAVPCGGAPYGDESLVFVANDWHAALLPLYLQAHYRDHGKLTYARAVLVLHNMAHQGRAPLDELHKFEVPGEYRELFRLDDPVGGEHMNVFKAGISTAHRVVAVSHGYAWECQTQEGGWGLDATVRDNAWKLRGVVNGIDTADWSPSVDAHLTSDGYRRYDIDSMVEGKAACKAALQAQLGLPVDPSAPLLGFIGRLDYQKGVDLIRDNYDWLMGEGAQLVLLGSGRDDLEASLREMEARNPDRCRAWVGFSTAMAHRITAAADVFLMPSRFEPCGLNQLYSMEYGTVPMVHAVGGLRDTVRPYNPYENTGTGWTFDHADAGSFRNAMGDALYTYRQHRESFTALARRGMDQDLSWGHAAEQYEEVLLAAKYQW
jgi:starch synthase